MFRKIHKLSDQDRNTASLIPGLGHLPIIGRLFGNNEGTDTRSEVILAITPRVLREVPAPSPETRSLFSGTMNSVRDRPILAEPIRELRQGSTTGQPTGAGAAARPAPAVVPAATGQTPIPPPPSNPGQILFNPATAPAPTAATPGTAAPAQGLPPPPPMIDRRAPARP